MNGSHHASRLRPTTSVRESYAAPGQPATVVTAEATTMVVDRKKPKTKATKKKKKAKR